ncbi:MAG: TRAP transporter TatT component family protein, partial [Polyangiaceae bacterium]
MHKAILSLSVVASLAFGTGCIKSTLTNGQISATREAAGSFETIGDYDLARSAAMAGMVQFEGMHKLAPDNEDALFMLMQGWTGYGYAFAEDDREAAMDAGDDDLAEYHRKRARMA